MTSLGRGFSIFFNEFTILARGRWCKVSSVTVVGAEDSAKNENALRFRFFLILFYAKNPLKKTLILNDLKNYAKAVFDEDVPHRVSILFEC